MALVTKNGTSRNNGKGDGFHAALPIDITIEPIASEDYDKLRQVCMDLPGVSETRTPEQTAFKVGQRGFVIVETYRDPAGKAYNCVAFKASFLDHERLVEDSAYFPAPYLGGSGWLGRRLDHPTNPIDWKDLSLILIRSHRQIAGRSFRPAATEQIFASVDKI